MSERVDFGTAKERRDRTGKGLSLLCEKPGFLSCGMAGLLCLKQNCGLLPVRLQVKQHCRYIKIDQYRTCVNKRCDQR